MRQIWLISVILLPLLIVGCAKTNSNIVGKWASTRASDITIEFQADGSVRSDIDINRFRADLTRMFPNQQNLIDAQVANMQRSIANSNAAGITWTKNGDLYYLSKPTKPNFRCYKLDGNKLKVISNNGNVVAEYRKVN